MAREFNVQAFSDQVKVVNGLVGAQLENTFLHSQNEHGVTLAVLPKHNFLFPKLIKPEFKQKVRKYLNQFGYHELGFDIVIAENGKIIDTEATYVPPPPPEEELNPYQREQLTLKAKREKEHLERVTHEAPAETHFAQTLALHFKHMHERFEQKYKALFAAVESPIERKLLEEILLQCAKHKFSLVQTEGPTLITITPQKEFRFERTNYRVDFYLEALGVCVIVECDGHDYHERTKAQATRDKKRDREFFKHGMVVLRFTGREIHNNAEACANEALKYLREHTLVPGGPQGEGF